MKHTHSKPFPDETGRSLNLEMQNQCQTRWCWSATSVSIALFYSSRPAWTQCKLVNKVLESSDCCAARCHTLADNTGCNQSGLLSKALSAVGHGGQSTAGGIKFEEMQAEIDAARPVAVTLRWFDGGGHIVAIDGYQRGNAGEPDLISIKDPDIGSTPDVSFDEFPQNYRYGAFWNRTVRTVKSTSSSGVDK